MKSAKKFPWNFIVAHAGALVEKGTHTNAYGEQRIQVCLWQSELNIYNIYVYEYTLQSHDLASLNELVFVSELLAVEIVYDLRFEVV